MTLVAAVPVNTECDVLREKMFGESDSGTGQPAGCTSQEHIIVRTSYNNKIILSTLYMHTST